MNSATPTTQSLGGESQDMDSLTSTAGRGSQGGVDSEAETFGGKSQDENSVVPVVQRAGRESQNEGSLKKESSRVPNDVQASARQRSDLPSNEGVAEGSEVEMPSQATPTAEECEELSVEASQRLHPAATPGTSKTSLTATTETEDLNLPLQQDCITTSDRTLGHTETNTKLDHKVTPDTKLDCQHLKESAPDAELDVGLKQEGALQVPNHMERKHGETPISDARLEMPKWTNSSDDIRELTSRQIEPHDHRLGTNIETNNNTLKERQYTPNGTLRHDNDTLNRRYTKTHLRLETGDVSAESAGSAASPCPPLPLRHEGQTGHHSNRSDHTPQSPLPPSATAVPAAANTTTATTYHRQQSDSANITKHGHYPMDFHPPSFPLSSSPPPYSQTKSHSNSSSPQTSLRRRNRNSNSGSSSTGSKYKQVTRNDRSPSQKPAAMSQPNRLTAGPTMSSQQAIGTNRLHGNMTTGSIRPVQTLAQLSEYKKTMHKADEFGRAMAALAESGSSDQDSDSEPPHSKLSGLPQDLAKVKEKMSASPSTVVHRVVICKKPGEVSFGFSISDGQYDQGVYVKTVKPMGPSDRGGLQHYDKIIRVCVCVCVEIGGEGTKVT